MEANLKKNDKIKYVLCQLCKTRKSNKAYFSDFPDVQILREIIFLQNGGKQNTKFRGARIVKIKDFETLTHNVDSTEINTHSFLAKIS